MNEPSEKNYVIAVSLCFIFGVMGIHHFYLGRWVEGFIDLGLFVLTLFFFFNGQPGLALLTLTVDYIHTFVITIMLLIGAFKDGNGKTVCYPGQKLK